MDIPISQIKPIYKPHTNRPQPSPSPPKTLIHTLNLHPHPEGGGFTETDRNPQSIHAPSPSNEADSKSHETSNSLRTASSTIFYMLTPSAPLGVFHRHWGRTIHTWHRGRGRYVIIHADEATCSYEGSGEFERVEGKARLESFVVGPDVARGERLQWVVGAGKYKASYLLPDISKQGDEGDEMVGDSEGLLISEVVVPGFDFADLDFLRQEKMEELLTAEQLRELSWMLKPPETGE